MRRVWLLTAVFAAGAPLAPPAGACTVICEDGTIEMELRTVELVAPGDPSAETPTAPQWPDSARLNTWGELALSDGRTLYFIAPGAP
jgi:hypothetical protein